MRLLRTLPPASAPAAVATLASRTSENTDFADQSTHDESVQTRVSETVIDVSNVCR